MERATGRPLRGRRSELALITTAFERARDGQCSTIALIGEPGIGKTRLATETATRAASAGFAVWWGRAWEAGGAPAYWPWRQLCDALPRDAIGPLWGAQHRSTVADPEQARFELFDAVTRAIATQASMTPIVAILDDLHVADIPSLELLAFATRHLRGSRVIWIVTWRDAEAARPPVRDLLARIAREANVLSLSALSEIDANQLIDDVRTDVDVQFRSRLMRVTGGNPLFLLETMAALAGGGSLPSELDPLPLAQGISHLVRERLAPLTRDVRVLAEAASAIGREVTVQRWTAATNVTAELVRDGARCLVEAGILTTTAHDRWRFGHDLVREAIYRTADEAQIIAYHRRIAHTLDREIATGDTSLVGERAHHALMSMTDDPATLLAWTVTAAEHALLLCAYEESLAIVERASAKLGLHAQRDASLQLVRGRAYLFQNDHVRASNAFSAAIALARRADDPCMLAAAVLGLGSRYVFGDRLHDLVALIDEAIAILPSQHRDLHARLLARKAAALTPAEIPEPVLDMARQAQQLIAESTNDAARLEVAVAVGAAFADFAHPRERLAINKTVVELARAQGDRALELRGMSRLVSDHISAGDLPRADALLADRDALARSLVQPRFAWAEPLFRSQRALIHGDFARCETSVAEAEKLVDSDPNCGRACAVHRMWLYFMADRVDELRAQLPAVLSAVRTMPFLGTLIRAVIHLRSGELADARREVDALRFPLTDVRSPPFYAMAAEVFAEVGPIEHQRDAYDALSPYADMFAAFGVFAFTFGPPIAATLGNLAGALGDVDRARAHFESALAMTTQIDAAPGRAWTSYWYGRMLARVGDPDANTQLDAAIRDATRLGMHGLVIRCRDAAGPAQPAIATPAANPLPALRWAIADRGGSWLVSIADRSFLIPQLKGMALLARLSANPHVEIHSLELVSGGEPEDAGDAGEHLDDKARAAYRKRLSKLADDLEEAQARGDDTRAETIRDEHEALVKELSRAVGRGGKVRRAGSATERARVAAHRQLREAIKKITEADAELGAHLDVAVRTGTFCVYRP
ncbi:MAG: AAA family ATPase [Kofleriaceae bacterium]